MIQICLVSTHIQYVLDLLEGPPSQICSKYTVYSSTKLPNIDHRSSLSLCPAVSSPFLLPAFYFSFGAFLPCAIHYANRHSHPLVWMHVWEQMCVICVFVSLCPQKYPQFSRQKKSNISVEAKSHHKQPLQMHFKPEGEMQSVSTGWRHALTVFMQYRVLKVTKY